MSLKQFEDDLVLKGLRQYTIDCHLQRLRQILKYCDPLTEETFRDYKLSQLRKGVKSTSFNRLIITLRHYGQFQDWEWASKCRLIPVSEDDEPHKEIFSDEEILHIIGLKPPPRFRPNIWYRWTVWLSVLAFSGMRASEVSTLTVNQIDWGSNNFILIKTKTRPRRVPIASNLKPLLKQYLPTIDYYVFPTPSPRGHVWRQGWQKHVSERMKLAGIRRPGLSTHSFRHSAATNLWEHGAPLPDIMNIFGWKNAQTALVYSHLGNKSAQKSINKHSIIQRSAPSSEQLQAFIEEAQQRGLLNPDKFTWNINNDSLYIACKEEV